MMETRELLEQLATQIANEFKLDKDAILNRNENIFYFINKDMIIEVDRKTHLSKCLYSGSTRLPSLLESIINIKNYLGY